MQKFYETVDVVKFGEGYEIHLDGRPVKTKKGLSLVAATRKLADQIAFEWDEQVDTIKPEKMPLTALLNTKIDSVLALRPVMTEAVLKFLNTDMLCYRASEPSEMVAMQAERYDPPLDWFAERFGTALRITTGLQALQFPQAIHDTIAAHVNNMSDDIFTVFQSVVADSGSIILGLMFIEKAIDSKGVYDCTRAEADVHAATYNEAFYGKDPQQEAKDKARLKDLDAAEDYLGTLVNLRSVDL